MRVKDFFGVIIMLASAAGCTRNISQVNLLPENLEYREVYPPSELVIEYELVFTSIGDLMSIRPDGSQNRLLSNQSSYITAPAISQDRNHVAYVASDSGNGDIMISTFEKLIDYERHTNITKSPDFDDMNPCWSPDGRQIAFSTYHQGNWGIFTAEVLMVQDDVEPVLVRQRRLTSNLRYEGHPDWSPDNNWIAYTSDRGFRWQIYLTHTSGSRTIPMTGTTNLRSTAYPAWSPDGSKIAFASTFTGSWDIYVMNTDGTALTQLTSHPADDWHPTWSPDGNWLAFVSSRSGVSDIYVVGSDGMKLIQLTNSDLAEDFPEW